MTPQTPQTPSSAAALEAVNRAAAAQSKAYDVYFSAARARLGELTWSDRDAAREVYYAADRALSAAKEASHEALAAYRAALVKGGLA